MNEKTGKFLKFNGKSVHFLAVDGEYWIALKPICEALDINYIGQLLKLKENEFLSQHLCEHEMVDADGKLQKMICLPEFFIYGWIFQIKSKAPGLSDFKNECFTLLYNIPTT